MKSLFFSFILLVPTIFLLNGCSQGTGEKENTSKVKEKSLAEIGVLATAGTLMAPETEAGSAENSEGIGHFKEGHWEVSEKHFRKALEANPQLAEAHYNLALTLDKLGNHGDATTHFRSALDLAPENPKIRDSQILKDHLGM